MAFQLTYGGVKISIPTQEELDLLDRFDWIENLPLFTEKQSWRGPTISRLPIPTNAPQPMPSPGVFWYPTSMSRWAWFCGLATLSDVTAMIKQAFPAAASPSLPAPSPVALPFVIQADDQTHPDSSGGFTTPMYLLPPRPLGQTQSVLDGMYLITLVDNRYFYQEANPGTWHTAQLTSWANLISLIGSALGISIANDAISSVYLNPEPDSDLYTNYESVADLLDAVAWNVGMAVVRNLDGSIALRRFHNADNPILGKNSTTYKNRPNPPYRAFGGDLMDPQAQGIGLGTAAQMPATWNTVLPASVTVTFPAYQSGSYYDPQRSGYFTKDSYGFVYSVPVTLASLGSPYSAFSGVTGTTKVIEDTAKACFSGSQNPSTDTPGNAGTALQPLAQQLAMDYYDLHLNGVDEAYTGIRDWTPDPVNDLCMYFMSMADGAHITTRVMRKPWNYGVTFMQHSTVCS